MKCSVVEACGWLRADVPDCVRCWSASGVRRHFRSLTRPRQPNAEASSRLCRLCPSERRISGALRRQPSRSGCCRPGISVMEAADPRFRPMRPKAADVIRIRVLVSKPSFTGKRLILSNNQVLMTDTRFSYTGLTPRRRFSEARAAANWRLRIPRPARTLRRWFLH